MERLVIISPQFENDDWIPDGCAGYGYDRSPELYIEGIFDGTRSLAVVMDDLDHPIRPGFNHWVALNIPPIGVIPGRMPKGEVLDRPIHIEQGIAYGKHCYRGPKPPFNLLHRYRFTVYALSTKLQLSSDSGKADLMSAIDGHVLAQGELFGKYRRKHK